MYADTHPCPIPVLAMVDLHVVREGGQELVVASALHVEVLVAAIRQRTEVGQLDETGHVLHLRTFTAQERYV